VAANCVELISSKPNMNITTQEIANARERSKTDIHRRMRMPEFPDRHTPGCDSQQAQHGDETGENPSSRS